ncbi:hypothetical protein G9A89_000028 [Geosiphon pyriformis]|nr:hypothetical protein G9A89_000028 [Geosiphon pyriformis]
MALINRATKEDVRQMKEAEYIEYIMELAGFDYEDEVKVYHQIASYTYPTQEAQIQQLEQINIRLCEEYIMPCDEQWCPECYALSIPLSSKNDEYEIEFGELEATEEIKTTLTYLIENQPALQLKYFNNNRQGIKPEKAHEINAGYDLRYPGKDTLTLKPKFFTKFNLKIVLKIPPGAMNTRSYTGIHLPELLKLALRENLMLIPISIPPNATIQQRLQLCLNEENTEYPPIYRYFHIEKTLYEWKLELTTANLTKEAIQKQFYNKFKTTAGSTNSHYRLRAAFRLYDLFHTCENVLQNPIF